MPRFDGTGPMGKGEMTGRGLGKCAGNDDSNTEYGYGRRGMRKGSGRGRRCGRGFGCGAPADSESTLIESLQERIQKLEAMLNK